MIVIVLMRKQFSKIWKRLAKIKSGESDMYVDIIYINEINESNILSFDISVVVSLTVCTNFIARHFEETPL